MEELKPPKMNNLRHNSKTIRDSPGFFFRLHFTASCRTDAEVERETGDKNDDENQSSATKKRSSVGHDWNVERKSTHFINEESHVFPSFHVTWPPKHGLHSLTTEA